MKRRLIIGAGLITLILVAGVASYEIFRIQGPCQPDRASQTVNQLHGTSFGPVTEYPLPGDSPWANAITVSGDGKVWFGEQGRPGVASLDPSTGKLTEYLWPCYPSSKLGPLASIWGITEWNGKIWATDGDANRLVGLNPSDGSVVYVNATTAAFPYLFAQAPDGSLWFTALTSPAKLGRLGTDLSLTVNALSGIGHEEPIQMEFVNSTFGYLVALNPYNDTDSGLYSFDPRASGESITAHRVGDGFRLMFPQALDVTAQGVWVAQHLPSNILFFDPRSGEWTVYPTSLITYESTTLPYFVQVVDNKVWFNEHYGNRISLLDPQGGTLTEFSESDPPVTNATQIQNDLTIAATQGGVWFTSTSGNYLGFLNGTAPADFSIKVLGQKDISISPSGNSSVTLQVNGEWGSPLRVGFSDSENYTSVPYRLAVNAGSGSIPAGKGPVSLVVNLEARPTLSPGRYVVGVTVGDGLLSQTAYIFLTVQ